ncbi:chorismate mutase [Bifidobacterium criceti]|uniref:Chorismate mutase n=1 Tax=Bifidobacterium criceti TaxID=1960969 RepID=A0A2A2EHA5_9BIFI|nr:chorismate mutase [Bifidobacterium criceti]PAU68549.1 chorismate mutase [Bifidobacterium criceti]
MTTTEDDWRAAAREEGTDIDALAQSDDPQTKRIVARIDTLRASIDNIDMAIVALLAERFKATAQVGALKARAGFAPADYAREEQQMERLRLVAQGAGLDTHIAEQYREFVVTETKNRHRRIADAGGDAGVLDIFA